MLGELQGEWVGRITNLYVDLWEMKIYLKIWNKQVFGDVRVEKSAIMNRIEELNEIELNGELREDTRRDVD